MFVQVTRLQYWKSEHDQNTCEDAAGESVANGLFVVTDGVGTRAFSHIWARILVKHFLDAPLMDNDPFEIEWWVRGAQEQYKLQVPRVENRGLQAQSTLAALRVFSVNSASAEAQLLVFGDSCIIIGHPENKYVGSFALQKPEEFKSPPICIPASLREFNRKFHLCKIRNIKLQAGEIVILATDAVARWIISAGEGHYETPWQAFQAVEGQNDDSWPGFIEGCRRHTNMADDDSTALILKLRRDGAGNERLGLTTRYSDEVIRQRREQFNQAKRDGNKELVAVSYGSRENFAHIDASEEEIKEARTVADAFREVFHALRSALGNPDAHERVEPIWREYASLLLDEPLAAGLRHSLEQIGIQLESPEDRARREALDRLKKAVESDNDEEVIDVWQHWQAQLRNNQAARPYFRRINLALILKGFREALASKDDEKIVKSYSRQLDRYPKVTVEERNLLRKSVLSFFSSLDLMDSIAANKRVDMFLRFFAALSAGDHDELLKAYGAIQDRLSFYDLPIDIQKDINPDVAIVNEKTISFEEVWKVCSVKDYYLHYRIWADTRNSSSDRSTEEIEILKQQIEDLSSRKRVTLEELVDDILLRDEEKELDRKQDSRLSRFFSLIKGSDDDLDARYKDIYKAFNKFMEARNVLLLNNIIPKEDVMEVLRIFVRRSRFEESLQRKQPPELLQNWLDRRRESSKIVYPEKAIGDEGTVNTYPAHYWLFRQ